MFDAIKHTNGHIGCFLSHKKCSQIAKKLGLKNIIIMEDDCILNLLYKYNFPLKLLNINNFLDSYDNWDIFLGGCNKTQGTDIIKKTNCQTENIYQIKIGTTSHLIIYNFTCYDFFLNWDITINTNEEFEPLDRIWFNKLKALTIIPFIAYQLNGFSSIGNCKLDYYRKIQITENRLLIWINNNKL